MTETIPIEPPQEIAAGTDLPMYLADILMNVIVALLAPMFVSGSAGDVLFARMAAVQTVNAYRAENQADLIAVAQIIAFGLAALGSLGLSMADNITLSMTLRLRGNANACNRSAEQNRRVLRESHAQASVEANHDLAAEPRIDPNEAEIIASVAATQQRAAEAQANLHNTPTPPAPVPPPVPAPAPPAPVATDTLTEQQIQTMWGAAMAEVAGEFTASLTGLAPSQRWAASRRAAVLSNCANELLSGVPQQRPRPGDSDRTMHRNGP